MGDVVVDADREMLLGLRFLHLGEHGHHHRRRELFRRETVAAADDARHRRARTASDGFRQRRDDVLVEWFTARAGFLGAVEHRDRAHRLWQGCEQVLGGERSVKPDVHEADAFGVQRVDRLRHGVGAGAHQDDDPFCVRVAVIVEQPVLPARDVAEALHGALDDGRCGVVVTVDGLARLEIHVGVLRGAADERVIRVQRAVAMLVDELVVHHRAHLLFGDELDLADFVRGTEAVEEMDEGEARFQRGCVADQREILRGLHGRRGEQAETGRARRHDVLVVAENRQRLRGQGA